MCLVLHRANSPQVESKMALAAKFTNPLLRSLQTESGQIDYADTLTPGLNVRVGKRTKTFMFRRLVNSKRDRITLGQYPAKVSTNQHREHAQTTRSIQSNAGHR